MVSAFHSSLELLESRIAPAGVFTLKQTGHDLVISGDNSGATGIASVQQLPDGEWVFEGSTGTQFQVGSDSPSPFAFLKGVTGSVTITFGTGGDRLIFQDVRFGKDVTIETGSGGGSIEMTNGQIKGTLKMDGGSAADSLVLSGVSIGHDLLFPAGGGSNFFGAAGMGLKVGGSVTYVGGTGGETVLMNGGPVAVARNFSIDGGLDGAGDYDVTPSRLTVGGALSIAESGTNSEIHLAPASALKVAGALEIHSGSTTGTKVDIGHFLDSVTGTVSLGSLLVDEGNAPGGDISITPSVLLKVAKDLTLRHGAADASIVTIETDVVQIGGSLQITSISNSTSGGGQTLLQAATSFSVGKDWRMQAGGGSRTDYVQVAGSFTVRGAIDLHFGAGTGDFAQEYFSVGTASVGKDVSLLSNGQGLTANLVGGAWSIGGNLTIHSSGNIFADGTYPLASLKVGGNMSVAAAAFLFFYPTITGALNVGGDLTISAGSAATEYLQIEPGSGKIGGTVSVTLGGDDEQLLFGGRFAPITIGGDANFTPGSQHAVTAALHGMTVKGNLSYTGAAGNDTVSVDDLVVYGKTDFNTGAGGVSLKLELVETALRRASTFAGDVRLDLGASDPGSIQIGVALDPLEHVTFKALVTILGGPGVNDLLDLRGATFAAHGQPVVTGFEHVIMPS